MKRRPGALTLVAQRTAWMTLLAVTACGNYRADDSECSLDGPPIALPGALRETSGVATGIRNPSMVWTKFRTKMSLAFDPARRPGHFSFAD